VQDGTREEMYYNVLFLVGALETDSIKLKEAAFSTHCLSAVHSRVARWYIFKPKIPIWVNRVLQWKILVYYMSIWYSFWLFGIVLGYLVYCVPIGYILLLFGAFSSVLVC
jgi:hypothetical protein